MQVMLVYSSLTLIMVAVSGDTDGRITMVTLTLSRRTGQVDDALMPSLSSFFPRDRPGVSRSTTNVVMPL